MPNSDQREKPEAFIRAYSDDPSKDVEMEDVGPEVDGGSSQTHFTVAIDFGTTFSLVSFIALGKNEQTRRIDPNQIESIDHYPDAPFESYEQRREVPTESWYPKTALRNDPIDYRPMDRDAELSDDDTSEDDEGRVQHDVQEQTSHADIDPDPVDEEADDENSREYFWGYGVQKQLQYPDTNRDQSRRIARSKLLLDTSQHTAIIREQLSATLQELRSRRLIKQDSDVIADFLERLFQHTKEQLTKSYNFHDACPVEFVLCVPAIWTQKACRTMQTAMATAISKSGFGSVDSGSIDNLFIVSEPEAAAACVLAGPNDIMPGDTFVLLDAGGGTVDAITYTVDRSYPLRLKTEAVKPGGALCGSSYLNEAFQSLLLKRLEGEDYLEGNGMAIKGIVDTKVVEFENMTKRSIDVTNKNRKGETIFMQGLRPNKEKRFLQNRLQLSREDLDKIFMPCLREVARLMTEQLTLAKEKHLAIKNVILIGGFAASPSLTKYLDKTLAEISASQARPIRLLCPRVPGTAVACGAVLRALRKEDGPARIIQSSYGFLQTEPHEPDVFEAHKDVRPWFDKLDGKKYVKNTIDWLVKKDHELPPLKEYRIPVSHTFPVKPNQEFLCKEVLYVSDESHESHYRRNHPKNYGAEIAGSIVADMTFLRTEGRIQPIAPEDGEPGKKHYKVEFDLVMIVDGRNLRYEARYPMGEEGQVQKKGQTCIAAAFVPGTR